MFQRPMDAIIRLRPLAFPLLFFLVPIGDCPSPVEAQRLSQCIAQLPFIQTGVGTPAEFWLPKPVQCEQRSFDATEFAQGKRQFTVLHIPVSYPAQTGVRAPWRSIGDLGEPDVRRIRKYDGEHQRAIRSGLLCVQVREVLADASPGINFHQQIGQVNSGKQVVEAIRPQIRFFGHISLEWRDAQDAVFQGDIRQLAFRKKLGDSLEAVVKLASALIEVLAAGSHMLSGWQTPPASWDKR